MARKVIWSGDAIADLAVLVRHIAEDNPGAAERTGLGILDQTRLLEIFPQAGRILPEGGRPSVREIQYPPWRIIYELPDNDLVVILRIWHAARGHPEV
jgi:toxin ParE1/3/4